MILKKKRQIQQKQTNTTKDEGVVDIVHECEWYNHDNVDHIPLIREVPKKKWGILLHSGEVLYQNCDIYHMFYPHWTTFLCHFLMIK